MTFESLTLTPFCMEILGVKKNDISRFLAVFSVRFWLESGKMCKNKSTFFIFTIFLQIFPVFFSRGRSTPGEGGTGKYWPPYQPPYQPST